VRQSRLIRQRIWDRLKEVAVPDARFHTDFSSFIPDFAGSGEATERLVSHPAAGGDGLAFVTPDNSMAALRVALARAGRPFVVSTYNIRRGFLLLEAGALAPDLAFAAAWLDGIEHFARPVTLREICEFERFAFLATGASAVTTDGLRFGKGHGFFDLEWGMFSDVGLVGDAIPVFAVVHDVQVVDDRLPPSATDIAVDFIATPSRLISVERQHRRPRGIRWELLAHDEIAGNPPLAELARLRGIA